MLFGASAPKKSVASGLAPKSQKFRFSGKMEVVWRSFSKNQNIHTKSSAVDDYFFEVILWKKQEKITSFNFRITPTFSRWKNFEKCSAVSPTAPHENSWAKTALNTLWSEPQFSFRNPAQSNTSRAPTMHDIKRSWNTKSNKRKPPSKYPASLA